MSKAYAKEILNLIDKSPTAYHVIANARDILDAAGYTGLRENEVWKLEAGGKYYVTRNDSSLIAFAVPKPDYKGFRIIASHSDSPCPKLKEDLESRKDGYVRLDVEKYGGMLLAPWFDRPLSVAGRILVRDGEGIKSVLVDFDKDVAVIPSLAIHMNRDANSSAKYNPQTDCIPLFGDLSSKGSFFEVVAEAAGVKKEDILSHDLFLYNRVKPTFWGADNEYIASSRLDDQECVYATFEGFITAKESENVVMHCVFDNEEVGSGTKQGADSTFLKDTLIRINEGLGRTKQQYFTAVANSFMISADNAHAVHPNYKEKADPVNRPLMNGGIVIKYNANQKYTTDAVSAATFKLICEKANVPYQTFTNRSDIAGGSTLGNISTSQVSINTVDIGLAQLAMHSPYESAGSRDPEYLAGVSKTFYES